MIKSRQVHNWVMRAAGILLSLVLVSLYMVSGLFARYTTSASGTDSARVAKFSITESGVHSKMITADTIPGGTIMAELRIKNDSEVAVEYAVTVTNDTNNLPLTFAIEGMTLEGSTFTSNLPANEPERTYWLKIHWPSWKENLDAASPAYSGMVDQIKVTVSATQID